MLDNGHFSEALKFSDLAIKADPANARARTIKARSLAATGNVPEAITLLESSGDASAGADTTQLLVEFYIQAQKPDRAVELARKVFAASPDRFSAVYDVAVHLLDGGEPERAKELINEIRERSKGEVEGVAVEIGHVDAFPKKKFLPPYLFPSRN